MITLLMLPRKLPSHTARRFYVLTVTNRGERTGRAFVGVYSVGGMKYYRISVLCTCIVIVPPRNEKRSASWQIFYDEERSKTLRTGDIR